MQLDNADLVEIDKARFSVEGKYSAGELLDYIKGNEEKVRKYIDKKDFANKLRERMEAIELRIANFMLMSETECSEEVLSDLNDCMHVLQWSFTEL